ncbi:hypothetical protein BBP40_000917 [Aspergillus hancockii]|nr:hypothetical protein BBP40_000917 [Aspergillus hancockii]
MIAAELEARNGWPEEKTIAKLASRAAGLYMGSNCLSICSRCRMKNIANIRLDKILQDLPARRSPRDKLTQIYTAILRNSVSSEYEEEEQQNYCRGLRDILELSF